MKIHAIQTGTVAITTKWREGVGRGRLRLVNTLLDREWTEPLPIYAFAIEHPGGVIVVDTGETSRSPSPAISRAGRRSFASPCASELSPSRRSARSSSGSGSGPAMFARW